MTRTEREAFYRDFLRKAESEGPGQLKDAMKQLALRDLYYLLVFVLARKDVRHDWLHDRCMEVQGAPDGYLDLWSREHYKSTAISFALTIQDILKNPEVTCGIFSCTRPLAKRLLRQIKFEFEMNATLKALFPDVLYADPRKESPKWSEDDGIIVKRKTNPAASTIEAWGLVDGQPTGKHFSLMVYDDVVTRESVTSPDMIRKVTEAWELSRNLSAHGGRTRYIGTRYHANDTYATIMERGAAIPRVYPATIDGKPDGEPVFLTRDSLAQKRREMGPYTFACLGAGTLVTMSDWSQKPIEDVQVGDEVVGYAHVDGSKTTLTPTRVVATGSRIMPAVESTMADGSVIIHTPEHKWWTNRVEPGRREYSPLGPARNVQQQSLCKALDLSYLNEELTGEQVVAAGYLAGMIDGEGGVRHATIQITQDCFLHPEVCEKIEWSMNVLGIKYGIFDTDRRGKDATRSASGIQRIYTIHGGRQERVRILHILGRFLGKRQCIVSQAYGTRNFGKGCKVKLGSQKNIGDTMVYNIQTETGNYIANGFCSKNSQMLQNPTADDAQGFDRAWLKHDRIDSTSGMNLYILVDPAGEKKKTSDYSVFMVVGLGQDENYYVVDMVRDRLNLTERGNTLMRLHRKYKPKGVGYERYGLQADIEFVQYLQKQENYRFDITELGGQMPKNDRIRRLIPLFEQGRVYLPMTLHYADYQGRSSDLVRDFVEQEYMTFPVSQHDDMMDCLARIVDPDFGAVFPKITKPDAHKKLRRRSAMTA